MPETTENATKDLLGAPLEREEYLTQQLITYLGNKRSFRRQLTQALGQVQEKVGGRRLRTADIFSGSGFVSRLMKAYSELVVANDMESYANTISSCYLTNDCDMPKEEVSRIISNLNDRADAGESVNGFITELYAPERDDSIQPGERVFYTADNARRLDLFASQIAECDDEIRPFLLGPLLSAASVHANTGGVFKGFYKDKATGIGRFGASKGDALKRILAPICLNMPVSSAFESDHLVFQEDAAILPQVMPEVDLCYLDPPYNQHPYGSNYFMLNLLTDYQRPTEISKVSGIPKAWNRSEYNVRTKAHSVFIELIRRLPSRFILISLNEESFVNPPTLRAELRDMGEVSEIVMQYNTYRASRNLHSRSIHVNEHLLLLDRKVS